MDKQLMEEPPAKGNSKDLLSTLSCNDGEVFHEDNHDVMKEDDVIKEYSVDYDVTNGDEEDEEREEAFREIVENARVEVVPPPIGHASHPRAFADYFHAKRNKTINRDFPSWDTPQQSPEYHLYLAKSELLQATRELSLARQEDARERNHLNQQTTELDQKRAEFKQLIVDTEPFIQQNKKIRARFSSSIARDEAKEGQLRDKTLVLRDDEARFGGWEQLMRRLVERYAPYQRFVDSCLEQTGGEHHDVSSLMKTFMCKLYAKYDLLSQLYRDVENIGVTQHDLGRKMAQHGETVKRLTDQVSDLRARVRDLTAEKSLLEKERDLLAQEKQRAASEWSQVQRSLDNAYKLFIQDAPPPPGRKKPRVKEENAKSVNTKSNVEKVAELQLQHDYLSQVLKVATRLHESADDTLRAHVSMDTIPFS